MAKTPEGKVKDAVVKKLKELGVYYFFPATHGYGRSGVPDIVCCLRGRFIGIECKAEGGKVTDLQKVEAGRIKDAGGYCVVIFGVKDVALLDPWLRNLREHLR